MIHPNSRLVILDLPRVQGGGFFWSFFLGLIVFFGLNGFYLFDESVACNDVACVLEVLFFGLAYFSTIRENVGRSRYGWVVMSAIPLVLTSGYMASVSYGQPTIMGVQPQRHWILAMLMYFPLRRLVRCGKLDVGQVLRLYDGLIACYVILILVQYVLGDGVELLHASQGERYGSVRLYVSTYPLVFLYFLHFKQIIGEGSTRVRDVFFVVGVLLIHVLVTKSRMGLVALAVGTLTLVLTQRGVERKVLWLGILIATLCLFSATELGGDVLESISSARMNRSGDTGQIREVGREFYMDSLLSSSIRFVFGCGFANSNWLPAVVGVRIPDGIFYVDNGIYGLLFYYGFLFLAWAVAAHAVLMRDAWRVGRSFVFFHLLTGVVGCFSLFPFCYVSDVSFALCLLLVGEGLGSKRLPLS